MRSKPLHLSRLQAGLLVGAAVVWSAIHLYSLTRYPLPTCDEGWYSSTAQQFLQQGNFGMPTVNNLHGLGDNQAGFGRLYLVALAGFFGLFGTGLVQARLLSLLGVLGLALATYVTGKRLYDRQAGLTAAILVAFAWDSLVAGHIVRPEIWLSASIVAALGYFWGFVERPSFTRGLLFGFVITLPMSLHPNGLFFGLGFGVLCLLTLGLRDHNWPVLIATGIGALIGGGAWLALQFLPNVTQAYEQWSALGHLPLEAGLRELVVSGIDWIVESFWRHYGLATVGQAVCFLAGVVLAIWQRGRANASVGLLAATSLVAAVFLKVARSPLIAILWTPLLILLLVGNLDVAVDHLARIISLPGIRLFSSSYLVVLPLLGVYVAGDIYLAYQSRNVHYQQDVAFLNEIIRPGSHVTAEGTWWLGLGEEHAFLDDAYFAMLPSTGTGELDEHILAHEFETLGLDYAILDGTLSCHTSMPHDQPYHTFVVEHCQAVGEWETPGYGTTQRNIVYKCSE